MFTVLAIFLLWAIGAIATLALGCAITSYADDGPADKDDVKFLAWFAVPWPLGLPAMLGLFALITVVEWLEGRKKKKGKSLAESFAEWVDRPFARGRERREARAVFEAERMEREKSVGWEAGRE